MNCHWNLVKIYYKAARTDFLSYFYQKKWKVENVHVLCTQTIYWITRKVSFFKSNLPEKSLGFSDTQKRM